MHETHGRYVRDARGGAIYRPERDRDLRAFLTAEGQK